MGTRTPLRRWIVGIASLLVVAAVPIPARAADGVLTLTGSATAYTTMTFAKAVTFDVWRPQAQRWGRFAGFYVEPVGKPDSQAHASDGYRTGTLLAREMRPPGQAPEAMPFAVTETVRPGTYRIYLIADGPTTLAVKVKGLTSRTITPRTRTGTAFTLENLQPHLNRVRNRDPLLGGRRSLALSMVLVGDVKVVYAGSIGACVVEPEGPCGRNMDGEYSGVIVNPELKYSFGFAVVYQPGMRNGRLEAVQMASNATGFDYVIGMGFALTLA